MLAAAAGLAQVFQRVYRPTPNSKVFPHKTRVLGYPKDHWFYGLAHCLKIWLRDTRKSISINFIEEPVLIFILSSNSSSSSLPLRKWLRHRYRSDRATEIIALAVFPLILTFFWSFSILSGRSFPLLCWKRVLTLIEKRSYFSFAFYKFSCKVLLNLWLRFSLFSKESFSIRFLNSWSRGNMEDHVANEFHLLQLKENVPSVFKREQALSRRNLASGRLSFWVSTFSSASLLDLLLRGSTQIDWSSRTL